MSDTEYPYWIAFDSVPGLGHRRIDALLAKYRKLSKAWQADERALAECGLGDKVARRVAELRERETPEQAATRVAELGIKAIPRYSDEYPSLLKEIYDPPNVLYYTGSLEYDGLRAVAVIGTRKPTEYGKRTVQKIVRHLASAGVTVVSGLAHGVDALAHDTTVRYGGQTLAVLGGALNKLYPVANTGLARSIIKSGGAVLSEFPPDVRAHKSNFPRRNRIISGMTSGTLVIEGSMQSGALITARTALEQNRDVFAIPGKIDEVNSSGTNDLIRRGQAKLVMKVDDILEELNLRSFTAPRMMNAAQVAPLADGEADTQLGENLGELEKRILAALQQKDRPLHIDELARELKQEVADVSVSVGFLELNDRVKRLAPMTFGI